jgi:site-specific DNA-adenine methylase
LFSYFGSKSKLLKYYPVPVQDIIIEPFAGSAKYALKYWNKNVILIEKFEKIYRIWKYLQQASKKDILSLPDIGYHEKIPVTLLDEERWLMGYCVSRGVPRPSTMGHKFNNWNTDRTRISNDIEKIRHWDIRFGDYKELENISATWFIDPPYQTSGYKYNFGNSKIDYTELADWCKSRTGQVIVCENGDADWLEFKEIKIFTGAFRYKDNKNSIVECVWTNSNIK